MLLGRIHIVRIFLITASLMLTSIYGYYQVCEWMAKWAFTHQSYFAADELILLRIPQTDLSSQNDFLVSEGEFEWQGEMVDVLHRELRSDTLYIYGFRDKAETRLRQEAAWLYPDTRHPDHQPISSRSHTKRNKWLNLFVLPRPSAMASLSGCTLSGQQTSFAYSPSRIWLPLLEILAPPPNR
ncbi:hypothetical protein WBJ53_09840 [Spirosoma sp. SC4-14]|uniref:hypothetical protein n=1 Tax=Spirosoma sp. SC4-14 TaxID=3128900 RepID=UPI0030D19B2B